MCLANNVVGVFKACKVVVFVLMGSQVGNCFLAHTGDVPPPFCPVTVCVRAVKRNASKSDILVVIMLVVLIK